MTPEQESQKEVRLIATSLGLRLLRNNCGVAEIDGRFIRFGLGNESKRIGDEFKSSDLIGITPITITPEMVGKQVGIFTAIEVKPKGFKVRQFNKKSREHAQEKFLTFVRENGGFSGFAASGDDLTNIIEHYKKWLKS